MKLTLLSTDMIWDGARHCAFTDLVRYRGRWLCAFREGASHALCCGKVRVLSSTDGTVWESAALLASRGLDLRDPKFSKARGEKLDLVMGATAIRKGRSEGRHPLLARSADGREWAPLRKIAAEGDWLWRVDRSGGKSYGITYRLPEKRRWTVHVLESGNGFDYIELAELGVPDLPNEATLRFRGDEAIALVRREGGNGFAWIGTSRPPYRRWRWNETKERVGGPNFIVLADGSMVAATRIWRDEKPFVAVCSMTGKSLIPLIELPSGGDCGYAGMCLYRGKLWVSYYSSHEGKSKIYLSKVAFSQDRTRLR